MVPAHQPGQDQGHLVGKQTGRESGESEVYFVYAMDGSGDNKYLRLCGLLDLTRQTSRIKEQFQAMHYYGSVRDNEIKNHYRILPDDTDRMRHIRTEFTGFTANIWLVGNRAV